MKTAMRIIRPNPSGDVRGPSPRVPRVFRWVAVPAMACWAGCLSVPDADEMRAIRSDAAAQRLEDLAAQATTDSAVFLSGPLLLSEALALALANNRTLQQERQSRDIARGRIQESYGEALPGLSWTGSVLRRDRELGTTTSDGTVVATRLRDQYATGLRLTQPLYNGRIGAALRTAQLYDAWVQARLRSATERVLHETIRAYYDAVLSAHLLEVHLASLATAEAQLADTRARLRQGMASNYDRLRAEVEVSNFQAQVLQARNVKDNAATTLFRLMGASPESDVELVDEIPLVEEDISFAEALGLALEHRADLLEAEYALRMQRESVAVARSRYGPEISGYVSQSWANPDPANSSRDRWGDEWQMGLQASWAIFDGFARRGALLQERARLRQLELALRDAEESVVSEIRQAVLSLKTAEEFARSQSRNLETAEEALRLVQAGLQEGQNTPVEVMDARQALTRASANYYQSLFTHALARVALQKAMGRLDLESLPDQPLLSISRESANAP